MNAPGITLTRFVTRPSVLAVIVCALFLAAVAAISCCALLNKCAAFDEPLHFMGAWMQTHYDDFRCNPEDPPLWKFYAVAGTDKNALTVQQPDLWKQMLLQIPAPSVHFANEVLYKTPGNDADHVLRMARARMLAL